MDIVCDNFSVCESVYRDMGEWALTASYARAKGWHIWAGFSQSGEQQRAVLCPSCVGQRRRLPPVPPLAEGEQLTLDL